MPAAASDVVVINASSGGGQMLRNAVALSAVTGRPVRVENIRASRPRPGLRPQHLLGLKAVADLCAGELAGAEIGSMQIEFRPGPIIGSIRTPRASAWRRPDRSDRADKEVSLASRAQPRLSLEVGTAGSLTLLLQCLLPALWQGGRPCALSLTGGTDVPFSPPFEYFAQVFLPALAEMGPRLSATCAQRGFYPKGGGQIEVLVKPEDSLRPLAWTERGEINRICGLSFSLNLPDHIVKRMRQAAANILYEAGYRHLDIRLEAAAGGRSEGCGITLWAECESGRRLGASALGERGKRAERVGEEAAEKLLAELASGAAVDSHLADQLIVWLALADGPSQFTASRVTDHLRNAIQVAEALTGARFVLSEAEPVCVRRL